jgi:hypothetical protein
LHIKAARRQQRGFLFWLRQVAYWLLVFGWSPKMPRWLT